MARRRSTGSGGAPLNVPINNNVELAALIAAELDQSPTFLGGDLISSMAQNLNCYNGNPYKFTEGEQSGENSNNSPPDKNRSTYQSNDVFNIVEMAMPALTKPFMSSEEICLMAPTRNTPDDEKIAKQQQDLINYNFFKENPGNLLIQNMFRNALTCKVGIMRVYWFEGEEYHERKWSNLTDAKFLELLQDEDMELIKDKSEDVEELGPDGSPVVSSLHTCTFRQKKKISKLKYESVLPENFFVGVRQWSLNLNDPAWKCTFCAERIYMVKEDLEDLGIDADNIDMVPTSTLTNQTQVQLARYFRPEQQIGLYSTAETFNPVRKPIEVFNVYIRYDSDGDGRSELHQVYYANSVVLQDNIIEDFIPYFAITPIPQPGNFYGYCPADLARPIQLNATSLVRSMLDNFYFNNIPLCAIDENRVDNDARRTIANRQPGSYFRVDGEPSSAVTMFPPTYAGDTSLTLLKYFDDQLESRTGINKMMAGLDADILSNNKGDATAMRVMTASEDRIALMAKNFAETGLKDMFYYAVTLIMQHETKTRIIRLREEFVEVDPRTWDSPKDITIKTGIGTSEEAKKVGALNTVLQNYQMLYQAGGFGINFSAKNLDSALRDQASAQGLKFPERYYQDPSSKEAEAFMKQQAETKKNQPPPIQEQALLAQAKIDEQRNALLKEKQDSEALFKEREIKLREDELRLKTLSGAADMHDKIENTHLKATEQTLKYSQHVPGSLVK